MNFAIKLYQIIGLNQSIIYTSGSRLIQSAGSLVTLLFIFKGLNIPEQGYYFTFSSILALRLFFELGLNNIIIYFTAHESASVVIGSNKEILERNNSSRLFSIFNLITKYYPKITLVFVLTLIASGYIYFQLEDKYNISWQIPWILVSINAGLNFLISPYFSFLEGLGQVKEIAFLRLLQTIISLLLTWTLLFLKTKLFAAPVASLTAMVVLYFLFYIKYKETIHQCISYKLSEKISYIKEIFPLQWKLAVSWISGYFIFHLFIPLAFKFSGADIAAKMGTSLAVLNSILFVSISWIQTKTPIFSKLIATKKYLELDNLFNRTLKQSVLISILLSVIFISGIYFVDATKISLFRINLHGRTLSINLLIFLSTAFILNNILGAIGIYLRSHKTEPLMINSLVFAIISSIGCTGFILLYGIKEMILWYLTSTIIITVWGFLIFVKFKRKR